MGCRANRYESDRLFEILSENHDVFAFDKENCDVLVVNTCTVTGSADKKSRQAIRSYKRANPKCKIIAFGCGANVSEEAYAKMEEVDFVFRKREAIIKFVKSFTKELGSKRINTKPENRFNRGFRTRALIKIQDGCNNFCSYCIIPRARGCEVSFSSKAIIAEAKEKEAAGFKEIVLTGINIGQWKEGAKNLEDLIEILLKNTSSVRFRISSIEPKNFNENFYKLFEDPRLCNFVHMPLQSGSDSVLKRMRRNYDTAKFLKICKKLQNHVPDIGLTTDVIVGFPGESDEEFKETCCFVKKIGFFKMHVFPYSKRKNTAAYFMEDQVPSEVKARRAKHLRKLSDEMALDFKRALLGKEYEVLVEKLEGRTHIGLTDNYIPVQFSCAKGKSKWSTNNLLNEFVKVKLESVDLKGKIKGTIN